MNTLYLSDLDGTLFTTKKSLSEKTIMLLNDCLAKNVNFAVATARMPYGCDYRLEPLNLTTPSILTNGVFLYDFSTHSYLGAKKCTLRQFLMFWRYLMKWTQAFFFTASHRTRFRFIIIGRQ